MHTPFAIGQPTLSYRYTVVVVRAPLSYYVMGAGSPYRSLPVLLQHHFEYLMKTYNSWGLERWLSC